MPYILLATCADAPGISAAVTGFVADCGGFIQHSQQHGDVDTGLLFLRIVFGDVGGRELALPELRERFEDIATHYGMKWSMTDTSERLRTIIAVSKFGHCVNDLLHRWRIGTLPIDVVGVVSNHVDMRSLVEWHGVPYHHLPISAATKAEQELAFKEVVDKSAADLVVLARYMQVLSHDLSSAFSGRCINMHHSFLPSFKGAKPYHQAYDRGVKIIGATAHYVTDDLDEGPIIEQDVERVDHSWSAAKLVEAGQDIEARVLARAVVWHAERRVLLNGNKTIVFR
jgi:formyltetrahydrofolate deformylase